MIMWIGRFPGDVVLGMYEMYWEEVTDYCYVILCRLHQGVLLHRWVSRTSGSPDNGFACRLSELWFSTCVSYSVWRKYLTD